MAEPAYDQFRKRAGAEEAAPVLRALNKGRKKYAQEEMDY